MVNSPVLRHAMLCCMLPRSTSALPVFEEKNADEPCWERSWSQCWIVLAVQRLVRGLRKLVAPKGPRKVCSLALCPICWCKLNMGIRQELLCRCSSGLVVVLPDLVRETSSQLLGNKPKKSDLPPQINKIKPNRWPNLQHCVRERPLDNSTHIHVSVSAVFSSCWAQARRAGGEDSNSERPGERRENKEGAGSFIYCIHMDTEPILQNKMLAGYVSAFSKNVSYHVHSTFLWPDFHIRPCC